MVLEEALAVRHQSDNERAVCRIVVNKILHKIRQMTAVGARAYGSIKRRFALQRYNWLPACRIVDLLHEEAGKFATQHFEIAITPTSFDDDQIPIYDRIGINQASTDQIRSQICCRQVHQHS